jgi:hypothetical protein
MSTSSSNAATTATTTATTTPLSSTRNSKMLPKNQPVPGLQHGMDYIQLGDSDLLVSKICCKLYIYIHVYKLYILELIHGSGGCCI